MTYIDDINRVASMDIPWEDLIGKNILITGATGMIGSTLIEVLLSHEDIGYHIYASGRNEDRFYRLFSKYINSPRLHFIKHDVREPLKSNVNFHIIIAAAGVASPQLYATDPVSVLTSNFYGVDNLFSYGIQHELERVIYVSSGEVYGEGDGRIFTEDYSGYVNCATVRACYPSAKRASESLCIAYGNQYGIDVRIARPCHIFGPNFSASDKRVYAQFIRNVLNEEDIVLKSSGRQYRSWCYVIDCVSALLYILLKGKNGQAYNVADESSNITIRELADVIADIARKKVIIDLQSNEENTGYSVVSKSVFSTEKLRILGWKNTGSLRSNLIKTIDAVKDRYITFTAKP